MSSPAQPVHHGQPSGEPKQGARRYPRTFGGLIGSMIVLVVVVVGYWVAQNLTHDAGSSIRPIDYRNEVAQVQQAQLAGEAGDLKAVYPTSLPQGWTANSFQYTPGRHPEWRLGFLTANGDFIGIDLAHDTIPGVVAVDIDQNAVTDATVHRPTAVGDTWRTFSDSGGDQGYATRLGDYSLLIYGSADTADFNNLLSRLTQRLLPSATKSALVPDGKDSGGGAGS